MAVFRLIFPLAALGLHCCVWAFSGRGEWELLFCCGAWLLIVVPSLVAEPKLEVHRLQ